MTPGKVGGGVAAWATGQVGGVSGEPGEPGP